MTSIGSTVASYSGAGSSGGSLYPACAWVSLTFEEQLTNFKRIILNHHPRRSFGAAFFKYVERTMNKLRFDPGIDIGIYQPLLGDPDYFPLKELFAGSTPLHWAVLMDDRTMVRYILKGRVDINASTTYLKETALHYATTGGNPRIVEDLLEHKADIFIRNASNRSAIYCMVSQMDSMFGILKTIVANNVNMCDEAKDTLLHFAAREGAIDLVTYLLVEKADVNLQNYIGCTPLHHAAGKGSLDVVTRFLHANADVNALSRYGWSPLHFAIIEGHLDIVTELVEHNANVEAVSVLEQSPLHMATKLGHLCIVIHLVEHNANVEALDNNGQSPLHIAVLEGHLDIVTHLVEHNANVNILDKNRQSPLHIAIMERHLDIVTHLVEHNANVEALDNNGQSPLHIAAKMGHLDIVTHLVEHNANVEAVDSNGESPLHIAAKMGHLDIVTHLVEHNANVEALDNIGESPLYIAAKMGLLDIVTHLVEHNANVEALDNNGQSPLHIAIMEGRLDIVTHLVEHNANVEAVNAFEQSPLHIAAKMGHLRIVIHLLEHNANVEALDNNGQSPLHIAVLEGHLDIVTHLVEHNANVNVLDKNRQSLLLHSIKKQWFDTSKKLLASGANVDVKDEWNNNALHLAIQPSRTVLEMVKIVKLLHEYNVDANAKNEGGESPFFIAVAKGHAEVVKELLQRKEKIMLMEECNGQTTIQIAFDNGNEYIKRALLQCDDVSRYVSDLYRDRQVYVDAANAILVGAALIASVTFASWLQPPLGYTTSYLDLAPSSSNINYVDVQHNVALRAFWIFNTLSFYFAIGTVVFGARSVLPRRRKFIKDIVEKLHLNLLVTSILLACSVFFVIIAFGIAGCIVLTPTLKFQWYMIVPTIFGGLVCFISLGFLFKSMVEDNFEKKR